MASIITLGLAQIMVGLAAPTGTMPVGLTKIGKTYQDTCKMAQPTSEVTEHYEEGKAAPEVRNKKKRMPAVTFSIMDPDPALLAAYVGGTLVAAAAGPPATPESWGFNGDEEVLNRAVQVQTEQGLWIDIPNGDIEAVVNADFSIKGLFMVDFTVTPLAVSAGKAMTAYEPV